MCAFKYPQIVRKILFDSKVKNIFLTHFDNMKNEPKLGNGVRIELLHSHSMFWVSRILFRLNWIVLRNLWKDKQITEWGIIFRPACSLGKYSS